MVIPKQMPWEIMADMPIPRRDAIIKALDLYGRSKVGWDDFAVSLGRDVRDWLTEYLLNLQRNGFLCPSIYADKEGRLKVQVLQLREMPQLTEKEKENWRETFGSIYD